MVVVVMMIVTDGGVFDDDSDRWSCLFTLSTSCGPSMRKKFNLGCQVSILLKAMTMNNEQRKDVVPSTNDTSQKHLCLLTLKSALNFASNGISYILKNLIFPFSIG